MHSFVLSNITFYKSQSHNLLCAPLNSPTILGTKTAPFFAISSSGSLDYQRLTAIWEPPPIFLIMIVISPSNHAQRIRLSASGALAKKGAVPKAIADVRDP